MNILEMPIAQIINFRNHNNALSLFVKGVFFSIEGIVN